MQIRCWMRWRPEPGQKINRSRTNRRRTEQAWGVMDILAVTDFPDIRLKAAIQSINEGNLLIIPREGGFMVRMYIELDKLKDERVDRKI